MSVTPDKPLHVAVIGAGPGGYAAAFRAADLGCQVTLIDPEENPGGVCLYRGCIPSKALLHAAAVIHESERANEFGISFSSPKIDRAKLTAWRASVVRKLTGGLGQLVKSRKVTHIRGMATFTSSHSLSIALNAGGTQELTPDKIILATGSSPITLPIFPAKSPRLLDSTSALELATLPKTLLVVGGGYIGLELGSVYAALGTKVTVVEMADQLLPGADPDLVHVLSKSITPHFAAVLLKTTVTAATESKNGMEVTLKSDGTDRKETFENVLVAVGRRPNSSGFGLEKTKAKITSQGFVQVDLARKTDDADIYAIGDITGQPMLAHKASHEAHVAVDAILGHKVAFEPRAIPAVVFTDPEVAWCGMTEKEARDAGREIVVTKFPWAASGRALTLGRSDGLTKLICDKKTERILGVAIVGPNAGELITQAVVAIEMAATASDLTLSIHPHPTLSETIMESAELFFGSSTHYYRPKSVSGK